jgi:hypothetical protein
MEVKRYYKDGVRLNNCDNLNILTNNNIINPFQRVTSDVRFFNDETGEEIWEPLHNRTLIAGAALTAQKLFGLDRSALDNTPTYDTALNLTERNISNYPTVSIIDENTGDPIGSTADETQRVICGFCLGQGGAGLDISDVFDVEYCSWITPDNLVPFRYPLVSEDNVAEAYYKGKAQISLSNGSTRNAYYFKEFSNTPTLRQSYVSTIGSFSDSVNSSTVYSGKIDAKAQTYVELHLKITKDDCREFFIAHGGLETAKINQLSLVSGWRKTVTVTKPNVSNQTVSENHEYMQDVRPFSLLNIPNEILSDLDKSISMIYTLYF